MKPDAQASSIVMGYELALKVSGFEPARTPVSRASIAASHSWVRVKPKTSAFSAIHSACTDLGIAGRKNIVNEQSARAAVTEVTTD